ncbi:MAG: lysine--tRNA ligase [Actinomycetota bacterium]
MSSSPYPYRFDRTASAASIVEEFREIEDGTETGHEVAIAGRLMLRREQGKLAFGVLADSSDRIQLFARANSTPDFEGFTGLNLGDWIGVRGQVMKTRRGELSVSVDHWEILAKTERPFPDKWHGISDPDLRYRQRYVDLWVTEEARATFAMRSKIMSLTRRWLEDQDFIEVETPVFHPIAGGAAARPFITHHNALDTELFLRIAPELYLKRLTVGGFEKVFEIARVFRNEGISTRHNPEFTMLELYQAYADYTDIMVLVENLVEHLALELLGTTEIEWDGKPLSLKAPWRRASMLELITEYTGQEFSLGQPIDELRAAAEGFGVPIEDYWGPGKLLLEIYEKTVESSLWQPTYVTDYPQEVSPLSRDHRELGGFVERFEGIVAGRELCNAFSELCDPQDQRERFEAQEADRAAGDDEAMAVDHDYLRALEFGLPPTGGLGIGMDRLVMLLTGQTNIRDVVLFPTLRPEVFD